MVGVRQVVGEDRRYIRQLKVLSQNNRMGCLVVPRLLVDRSRILRLPVLVVLAVLVVGGALGLASLGGRLALAGIAVLEGAVAAGLLWWAGKS
jgi:hypothetical protein